MNRQNVTLSLPKTLIKKAKMVALREDKSLSELLRESLENKVREDSGYKQARVRQLKRLAKGFDLDTKGKIDVSREELHARK